MNPEQVLTLFSKFLEASLYAAGPVLLCLALVGAGVGILQTATQINEPSIAFAAKAMVLAVLLFFVGPMIIDKLTAFTRENFTRIEKVVE
jgi:flagellar biosynthesis protein FliQ